MIEIIFFGRGGQGGVTSSQILAKSAIMSSKYSDVFSFPSFGAERRGAPVEAYCRISKNKIWKRSQIAKAHIGIILDTSTLDSETGSRFHEEAVLLINSIPEERNLEHIKNKYFSSLKKATIIASDLITIAKEIELLNKEALPVINTSILGLLAHNNTNLDLDDIQTGLEHHFGKGPKTDKNFQAAKRAYDNAKIIKWD